MVRVAASRRAYRGDRRRARRRRTDRSASRSMATVMATTARPGAAKSCWSTAHRGDDSVALRRSRCRAATAPRAALADGPCRAACARAARRGGGELPGIPAAASSRAFARWPVVADHDERRPSVRRRGRAARRAASNSATKDRRRLSSKRWCARRARFRAAIASTAASSIANRCFARAERADLPPREGAELFHGTLAAGLADWIASSLRRTAIIASRSAAVA